MSQYLPYRETIHELRKYLTGEEERVLWWRLSCHSYCFEPSVQALACYWPDVQRLVPSTRQLYVESLQPLKISRIQDEPERDPVRPPAAAPAVDKLSGKQWVPVAYKRRAKELGPHVMDITEAGGKLSDESQTAPDCAKPLSLGYCVNLLRGLNVWPKKPRNSP